MSCPGLGLLNEVGHGKFDCAHHMQLKGCEKLKDPTPGVKKWVGKSSMRSHWTAQNQTCGSPGRTEARNSRFYLLSTAEALDALEEVGRSVGRGAGSRPARREKWWRRELWLLPTGRGVFG